MTNINIIELHQLFSRKQSDLRILLNRPRIPIFCRVEVTQGLVANCYPFTQISSVKGRVSVCHEQIDIQRVSKGPVLKQFACPNFELIEIVHFTILWLDRNVNVAVDVLIFDIDMGTLAWQILPRLQIKSQNQAIIENKLHCPFLRLHNLVAG